LDFLKQDL